MRRIAVADNNNGKFTNDLMDYWKSQGHEVRFERGASEYLAQWADVYFTDTWDNNIHYLYKLYHGQQEIPHDLSWDNNQKPKIIVRALDWEVWIGYMRDQAIVDWVDNIVFIASHIRQRVASEVDLKGKDILIRPGVNLDKFTLKKSQVDNFQLGMVLGDMWWPKNHMAGLDIFTQLYRRNKRWRLHIRGQHEGGNDFWREMMTYYVNSRGITDAVLLYDQTEDMNEWYENISILLHPGMKEAFCYAVGEAMAKGIPAIINNFMGSKSIWPKGIIYDTHDEAVRMIEKAQTFSRPEVNRRYIENYYPLSRMCEGFDKLL